jgi:DNA-binding transcriptional regulator PaaX
LLLKFYILNFYLQKNKDKNLIIIFDIPEKERQKRDWLRGELVALGFVSLQKSVWFGPAPIPKKFIEYLAKMNIISYLKFFKATETDLV